jgi:hypothetical protein
MTVQSVVKEVCAVVGVRPPAGSIFVLPSQDRTAWEMVNLANEMAQRIAYNTRDWQKFRSLASLSGDGVTTAFDLPTDWHRMLLTSSIYSTAQPTMPLTFIDDPDEWLTKEMNGFIDPAGSWTIYGDQIHFRPVPPSGVLLKFWYMHKYCITLGSGVGGGPSDVFLSDTDVYRLPERLLKLGMIWQWKANKGGTYAEDIANYEDALSTIAGSDKPSPIIIGRQNMSAAVNRSYPYPTPSAPETPYP